MQRGGRGFARRAIETEIVLRELCEITQRRMRGEGGGERASELAGVVYLHSHTRTHTKHTRSHTDTRTHTRTVYSLQFTVTPSESETASRDDRTTRCDAMAMAKAMAMLASRRAKHDVTHTRQTHTRRRKSMKNVDSSPSHTDSRTHTITAHRQGLCEPETRRRTRTTHANAR